MESLATLISCIDSDDEYVSDQTDSCGVDDLIEKIDNLNKNGQHEKAREIAENVLLSREVLTNQECCYLYYCMGESYEGELAESDGTEYEQLKNKAFECYKRASEYAELNEWKSLCFRAMAENCRLALSRRYYIAAMCNIDMIPEMTREYKKTDFLLTLMNDSYKFLSSPEETFSEWGKWSQEEKEETIAAFEEDSFVGMTKDFGASPYIFIAQDENHLNGCYDPTDTIFWVFTKNKTPECLTFPNGHPMANTLYIPHPLHPTQYLPMEQAEQMLFMDKVREFCYIAQCLGAKKIEFFTASGQKLSTHATSNNSFDASGNFKMHEMSGNYSHGRSRDYSSIDGNEINMNQTFEPKSAPYCPDDVEWYHKEKGWKDLVRQRLNGNLTHYDFYISSQETTNINESEEKAISIAYNNILMSLKANYKNTQKTSIALILQRK